MLNLYVWLKELDWSCHFMGCLAQDTNFAQVMMLAPIMNHGVSPSPVLLHFRAYYKNFLTPLAYLQASL